ncbi:MAG TPA: hypothetical protein VFA61_00685 [Candidatus Udaeobacter sp.]|nr:hypothetical protein [Candidatus Udaeobacter sp.]
MKRTTFLEVSLAGADGVLTGGIPEGRMMNEVTGMNDIEGKAARVSGERVRATSEFQL